MNDLRGLRSAAVANALSGAGTLQAAIDRLGFARTTMATARHA